MFNLSEKVEIPAKVKQPAANSYDRSMMSLFEKNQANESEQQFTTSRVESSILNNQIPELNYEASEIELNQDEIEIFKLLNNTLIFNNLKDDVKLMATGGWVRDKYLGADCKNITIIINSDKEGVSANEIAYMMKEYQTWEGGNELS